MQTSSPEAAQPSPTHTTDDDVVARFFTDHVEPMRARQPRVDAARPAPLPMPSHLLAEALAARRITVKKVTEGRWVFEFAGTIIGGYLLDSPGTTGRPGGGVTTLVSAHARRVLRDPEKVRAHLALMEIPHPAVEAEAEGKSEAETEAGGRSEAEGESADEGESEDAAAQPTRQTPTSQPPTPMIQLRAYVVGPEAVSVLAVLPDSSGQAISVEATDLVAEELRTLAVDAMRAIPGLLCSSVTITAPAVDSAEGAEVVGIDEAASITPHHYPSLGRGRPVADAIAEQILFTAAV